ncbi:MAG: hypothetical protein HKN40_01735 [Winogradskyella sp.]|uniref:hypothetical protein n=1 Tax=Winogradskyella sp. TaxID=1883156 RepID=UPI00181C2349|nr:hypothetical protein [Winogradskyella sp.]
MANIKLKNEHLNAKLIALWAVSESALGGFLHAIKMPFSGLFLGSFAIIIITYLAHINTKHHFSVIVKATILVVLIKAIASPHSPPMAYIAVIFQGLLGATIYGTLRLNRFTAIIFGSIALLESAFQKVLTLTFLFGAGIWESVQEFFDGLQNKLQMEWITDLPLIFLTMYGLLYVLIGAIAGNFAFKLPQLILENSTKLKTKFIQESSNSKKQKKKTRIWIIIVLLIFSSSVFLMSGMSDKALYIILRTFGAIILFLFIINPIFKFLMQKWVSKSKIKNQENLEHIIHLMPDIKSNITQAQQLSASEKGVFRRSKQFIINWLSLTLHNDNDG